MQAVSTFATMLRAFMDLFIRIRMLKPTFEFHCSRLKVASIERYLSITFVTSMCTVLGEEGAGYVKLFEY